MAALVEPSELKSDTLGNELGPSQAEAIRPLNKQLPVLDSGLAAAGKQSQQVSQKLSNQAHGEASQTSICDFVAVQPEYCADQEFLSRVLGCCRPRTTLSWIFCFLWTSSAKVSDLKGKDVRPERQEPREYQQLPSQQDHTTRQDSPAPQAAMMFHSSRKLESTGLAWRLFVDVKALAWYSRCPASSILLFVSQSSLALTRKAC